MGYIQLVGSNTFRVRILNAVIHLLMGCLITAHYYGLLAIDFPYSNEQQLITLGSMSFIVGILSLLSFIKWNLKLVVEIFTLALGADIQIVLGIAYFNQGCPFDLMLFVNILLVLWFFFSALCGVAYYADKEDKKYKRRGRK